MAGMAQFQKDERRSSWSSCLYALAVPFAIVAALAVHGETALPGPNLVAERTHYQPVINEALNAVAWRLAIVLEVRCGLERFRGLVPCDLRRFNSDPGAQLLFSGIFRQFVLFLHRVPLLVRGVPLEVAHERSGQTKNGDTASKEGLLARIANHRTTIFPFVLLVCALLMGWAALCLHDATDGGLNRRLRLTRLILALCFASASLVILFV